MEDDFAMTGVLSLAGEVLEVGGLEAKLLHAHEGQYRRVVIPQANRDEAKRLVAANQWDDLHLIPVANIQELVAKVYLEEAQERGECISQKRWEW